jgi:hypothetical protein
MAGMDDNPYQAPREAEESPQERYRRKFKTNPGIGTTVGAYVVFYLILFAWYASVGNPSPAKMAALVFLLGLAIDGALRIVRRIRS